MMRGRLEAGGVEVLGDATLGEDHRVVGEVPVLARGSSGSSGPMIAIRPPGRMHPRIFSRKAATASWLGRCSRKFETKTPSKWSREVRRP